MSSSTLSDILSGNPKQPKADGRKNGNGTALLGGLAALAIFLVVYQITFQDSPGDTDLYRTQIFRYQQSGAVNPSLIWEFGHLFWRPLVYFLWHGLNPILTRFTGNNQAFALNAILFGLNFVSAGLLSLLTFCVARFLGLGKALAVGVSSGFILCSVVLNYMHSGTAYLPGLALQLTGAWLLLRALKAQKRRYLYAILGGAALALSVAFWFVYVLGLPAVIVAAAILPLPGTSDRLSERVRSRGKIVQIAILSAGALGLSFFLAGAAAAHISTLAQLKLWIVSSGHSTYADRRLLRFPAGLTRTFLYLGDEGKALKRFAFGDPYEPVRWPQLLIQAGLWKVLLVFSLGGAFLWALTRTREGRVATLVALAGLLPTLWFALFLFETGQSERYLPFYPALLLALCVLLGQATKTHLTRWIAAGFLGVLALVNLKAYAFDLRRAMDQATQRKQLIAGHSSPRNVILILFYDDPLLGFSGRRPFNPANQADALPTYLVMELQKGAPWNAGSSCRILRAWRAGGEAWLSKRLIAARPEPSWGWVENDHPALPWTTLSGFFNQLDRDADLGGADGFVRVTASDKDRLLLEKTCGDGQ